MTSPAPFDAVTAAESGAFRRAKKRYIAVSWDVYLLPRGHKHRPPTTFADFHRGTRFDLQRRTGNMARVETDARSRTLRLVAPRSSSRLRRRSDDVLTLICESEARMHALARQVERAIRPVAGLRDLMLGRMLACAPAHRRDFEAAVRTVMICFEDAGHSSEHGMGLRAGDVSGKVGGVAESDRGTCSAYEGFVECVSGLVGLVSGGEDAVGVLERVCGTVPFVAPVIALVGLACDLARIVTEREEMNKRMKELAPECHRLTRRLISAILFNLNFAAVNSDDVQDLLQLLDRCCGASRSAERFVVQTVVDQAVQSGDVRDLVDEVASIRSLLLQLRTASSIDDLRSSVDSVQNGVEAVQTGVGEILSRLQPPLTKISSSRQRCERFRPAQVVPDTPLRKSLDFSIENTPEGQLKIKMLSPQNRSQGLIGLRGMSGTGKSTILIFLVHDPDTQRFFSGGVYCLNVGQGCDASAVITELAKIVQKSGGFKTAREVSEAGKLLDAVDIARDWFSERRCLFVFDDLHSSKHSAFAFLDELRTIVDVKAGSRAIFSSRDNELCGITVPEDCVLVTARNISSSLRILCCHAQIRPHALDNLSTDSVVVDVEMKIPKLLHKTLQICDGLPLSLAVAGSTISALSREGLPLLQCIEMLGSQLNIFEKDGKVTSLEMDVLGAKMNGYEGFQKAMLATWAALENGKARIAGYPVSYLRSLHIAFCVFERQTKIPIAVLKRLWAFQTDHEAKIIAMALARLGMAEINYGISGRREITLSMHDLVRALCGVLAKEEKEMSAKAWHRQLISGYLKNSSGGIVSWFDCSSIDDDGYMREHLAYHLLSSGAEAQLEELLLDFRWLQKRIQIAARSDTEEEELLYIERDYRRLAEYLRDWNEASRKGQFVTDEKSWNGILVISEAIRLSWRRMVENPLEAGFQLHGRLFHLKAVLGPVHTFLGSIVSHSESPWIQSVQRCLTPAGGALRQTIPITDTVTSLTCIPQSRKILVGTDGPILIVDLEKGAPEINLPFEARRALCFAVSADGNRVAAGSGSGYIYVWNIESLYQDLDQTCFCTGRSEVCSVSFMPDGLHLVTGSGDSNVRIWDVQSGEEVRIPLTGHSGAVCSVDVHPSGQMVVSGSFDCTIRIWKLKGPEKATEMLTTVVQMPGIVRSVLWLPSGEHIVASYEKPSDAVSQELLFEDEVDADFQFVIESCQDLCICKYTGEIVSQTVPPVSGRISSVAVSSDGKHIFVGCRDGTLQVISPSSLALIQDPLRVSSLQNSDDIEVAAGDCSEYVLSADFHEIKEWYMSRILNKTTKDIEHLGDLSEIIRSTDGIFVAVGTENGNCYILKATSGEMIWKVSAARSRAVVCMAFSPSSVLIAVGCRDHSVTIWDVMTGQNIYRFSIEDNVTDDDDFLTDLEFTKDETCIQARLVFGIGRSWSVETGKILNEEMVMEHVMRSLLRGTSIRIPDADNMTLSQGKDQCGLPVIDRFADGDLVLFGHGVRLVRGKDDSLWPLLGRFDDEIFPGAMQYYDRDRRRLWCALRGGVGILDLQM